MVTGATGTGKSTTVYAILQHLNTISRNIITVEDPVEMKIAGINQVQVMSEIGLTFASALRSILRQDPKDVYKRQQEVWLLLEVLEHLLLA